MIYAANKIIRSIFKENFIIHIGKEFNKIIIIVNWNTTYGNILDICDKSLLEKLEIDMIRQILN